MEFLNESFAGVMTALVAVDYGGIIQYSAMLFQQRIQHFNGKIYLQFSLNW